MRIITFTRGFHTFVAGDSYVNLGVDWAVFLLVSNPTDFAVLK